MDAKAAERKKKKLLQTAISAPKAARGEFKKLQADVRKLDKELKAVEKDIKRKT